jgi:uncharacterized protein
MLTSLLPLPVFFISLGFTMTSYPMTPTATLTQAVIPQPDPTIPVNTIWQNVTNPQIINLQQLLKDRKWAAADQETRQLLKDIDQVPSSLLSAIDRAWLEASNHRFGLSIQAKIWQESLAQHPQNRQRATDAFRDRIGWKLTKPRQENDFISSDWLNELELNYSDQAPIGHLPWAGVADAEVYAIAAGAADGCGSCTTDAMQLRNERFYHYLPLLFDRVQRMSEKSRYSVGREKEALIP